VLPHLLWLQEKKNSSLYSRAPNRFQSAFNFRKSDEGVFAFAFAFVCVCARSPVGGPTMCQECRVLPFERSRKGDYWRIALAEIVPFLLRRDFLPRERERALIFAYVDL